MDRESIQSILEEIQGGRADTAVINGWVSAHCPLAPWTHAKGTDRNRSFGVKINDTGTSIFNCLTCHSKGPLSYLVKRLGDLSGEDFTYLIDSIDTDEVLGTLPPSWERRKAERAVARLGEPVSDDYLLVYDSAVGHPYLRSRGISDDTAEQLDLRVDPDNYGHERILFPVYSAERLFYGYTGRAVRSGAEPRIRDYFGLSKRLLLLGSEHIDRDRAEHIILVEGLFDFARLYNWSPNVVSSMHATITDGQAAILKDFGLPVIVMYDNDKAGWDGTEQVVKALSRHVPVMATTYPVSRTVRDAKTGYMRAPLDPAELLREQYERMVQNCELQ